MFFMEHILYKTLAGIGIVATALWAADSKIPYVFQPSGLHGVISNVTVLPVEDTQPLPVGFTPADLDLPLMAAWSLRVLRKDVRPNLDYRAGFLCPSDARTARAGWARSHRPGRHGCADGLGISEHAGNPWIE